MASLQKIGFFWLLLAATVLSDETRQVSMEAPGLVELPCVAQGDVDVSWDVRQPVVVDYRSYQLAQDGGYVCVFYGHADTRYVIIADVIKWDDRQREKTTWVVTVGNDPEPNPDPDPEDPRPLGLAGEIYDEALKVNQPEQAKRISAAFETVRSETAGRADMTPRESQARLQEELDKLNLTGWKTFGTKVTGYLNEYAKSRQSFLSITEQIVIGLEAAAK